MGRAPGGNRALMGLHDARRGQNHKAFLFLTRPPPPTYPAQSWLLPTLLPRFHVWLDLPLLPLRAPPPSFIIISHFVSEPAFWATLPLYSTLDFTVGGSTEGAFLLLTRPPPHT